MVEGDEPAAGSKSKDVEVAFGSVWYPGCRLKSSVRQALVLCH